jgi:excisionase family DNA binding protein
MSDEQITQSRWLTAAEVADRLNVSPQWVYRQALSGQLPFIHLGDGPRSPLRVDPDDFTAWLRGLKRPNGVKASREALCG